MADYGSIFLKVELVRDIFPINVSIKFEKNPLRIVACMVFKTLRNLKHKFSAHKLADYGPISLKVELVRDIVPINVSIKFENNP